MSPPARAAGLILLGCALAWAVPAAGQEGAGAPSFASAAERPDPEAMPRPVAHAAPTVDPPVLDGRLDEAAWLAADSLAGFIQSQPDAGRPATEPTVVRLLYDERALYIGAVMYDSDPAAMVVSTLEKDFPGESTRDYDIFGFTLDTFHDRRNSFIYLVNPHGAVRDGQTFDDSRDTNFAWDGVFEVRTRIHEHGWTLEMRIPWTSLRYDPARGEQTWGINFLRRVRRKSEDSYWAPLDRRDPVHRMSKAGTLEGVRGLRPSRNLAVTPYLAAGSALGTASRGGDQLDAGFDAKFGVTPQLTLDLTYRTDFSQVEVDEEQVNLTRFSVFFPEKREFFVENSGVFTFGDVAAREYRMGSSLRDFTLFHSRRIGLRDGVPVPILGGGRLSGRLGGTRVGVLSMQTEAADGGAAENFSVARLRRTLLGAVEVGAMVVNRQDTEGLGDYDRSWGVDADARLWDNLLVSSYLAGTDADGAGPGDRLAGRLVAAWRDRLWDASAMYKRVGEGFAPGVGFVRRTGMRQSYATLGLHPRPRTPLLQVVNPYVEVDYITDPADVLETRTGTAGLGATFGDGATLRAEVSDRFERLDEPFEVAGGGVVPVGRYRFREGSLRYQSSQGRALSGSVSLTGGEFFHGERRSLGVGGGWRASHRLSLELTANRNDIRLPDRDFEADLYGARVRYSHSTRLFGSAFVQYNQAQEQLVTNLRMNLIHAPLSDLFLVYTERRGLDGSGVRERLLTAKLTRMIAL